MDFPLLEGLPQGFFPGGGVGVPLPNYVLVSPCSVRCPGVFVVSGVRILCVVLQCSMLCV